MAQEADPALVLGSTTHQKGAENPVVTIVEFSDFQCPACKAAQPAIAQVLAQYPEEIRVVYRHFPLTMHQYAPLAARASEVASEYGMFWEFHDLLFENQTTWEAAESEDAVKELFSQYADTLEIDKTEFLSKIDDKSYSVQVEADLADGYSLGVNSTPTLYVNNTQTTALGLQAAVEEAVAASQQPM